MKSEMDLEAKESQRTIIILMILPEKNLLNGLRLDDVVYFYWAER